jgi:prepilin-type N-terminal cleavage/methylation domain-containing protein
MNTQPPTTRRSTRGFTLMELTLVLSMGAMIAAILMALFNQQLTFLRIFRAQSFLNEEAPMVSMHVARIIGRADRFRLHADLDDALANENARLTESPVLLMNFRQPDGQIRVGILAFETRNGQQALYYHLVPEAGAIPEPQWFVTDRADDVRFSVEEGVLRMRLTGPAGEQITYSGTMQQ